MSSNGAALARLLGAHPHWLRWVDCAALVEDGVAFSAGRLLRRGDQSSGRDGDYTPLSASGSGSMPRSNSIDSSSGSRRQRGRSRPQGSGKETRSSRTERAAGSKSAHKQRQLSSPTGAAEIEGSGAGEPDERERSPWSNSAACGPCAQQSASDQGRAGLSQVTL